MGSIRKIDGDLYGSRTAFPRLEHFSLSEMECLEEWNAAHSSIGEYGSKNYLSFPKLYDIDIDCCPSLRFKACSPPGNGELCISRSDQVLMSSWENRCHASDSSTAGNGTKRLYVTCCEAPLHQWSLLRLFNRLTYLYITDCSDLTCSSTDLLQSLSSLETLIVECRNPKNTIVVLPERLGDLASLTKLKILNCKGIKALPDSVQQLSCLQRLEISGCPELIRWCESEENEMKLAHIKEKILNGKPLRVIRSQRTKMELTETYSDEEPESQMVETKTNSDQESEIQMEETKTNSNKEWESQMEETKNRDLLATTLAFSAERERNGGKKKKVNINCWGCFISS